MRILSESTEVDIEAFDATTGERVGTLTAIKKTDVKHYNIKRLNMKIWQDGMDWVYLQVGTSRTNTMIFNTLKNEMDKENEIRSNITKLAEHISVDGSTIRKIIKKLVDINFLYRKERGVYLVNPYVVKAKGQSNKTTEGLQAYWASVFGVAPTAASINETGKL